jgi:hypothetical protein
MLLNKNLNMDNSYTDNWLKSDFSQQLIVMRITQFQISQSQLVSLTPLFLLPIILSNLCYLLLRYTNFHN